MSTRVRVAVVCCFFFLGVTFGWVQRNVGLTGAAADPSGAVVPNVKVIATQILTGVTTSTPTDSAGVYQAAEVLAGRCRVEGEAPGVKKFSAEVTLESAHVATVNLKLELGSTDEV